MAFGSTCSIPREHCVSPTGAMETLQQFAGMDDRFSALSEQIAYHILSFLNVDDLGRLMLVSKRCKSLCVSAPSLTVDNRNYTHDLISRQRFNQFVYKFLDIRENSGTKTRQFNLVWSFQGSRCDQNKKRKKGDNSCDTEECLIDKRLSNLSFGGAERISISVVPQEGRPNYFPDYVLLSKYVKDITFCSNNCVLEFPKSFWLNRLSEFESLTLQSARIPSKFFGDLISELYSLKSLYLYDCSGLEGIYIRSSSLKQLKIINEKPVDLCHLVVTAPNLEKIFLTWYPADFSRTSFQISCSASALQEFVWYGYPVSFYYSYGNWCRLQCAALYLTLPPGSEAGSFSKHDLPYVLPHLERSAKFLRLHATTVEILFKLGHLTTPLDAVRNLAIDYCFLTDDQVPIIASFLKTISRLEIFYLTSSPAIVHGSSKDGKGAMPGEDFGFNVEYWESQGMRFVDELRKAGVEVHREEGNDLELVKYLLKHASKLEYLTIVCAPSLASSIQGRLKSYMKASTKLELVLKA